MIGRAPRTLTVLAILVVSSLACDGGGDGGGGAASGLVFGPTGAQVGLSIGQESLTATVGAASDGSRYGQGTFQSTSALDPATVYDVALTHAPSGQTCSVFAGVAGTGAELSADGAVRVGCEWSFDLLGRSTDDKTLAYSNDSQNPVIGGSSRAIGASPASGEGRYVAFRAGEADLVPGVTGIANVFWRDRWTGETRLVSHTPSGGQCNDNSWKPAISADGLWVAFYSASTDLVANDTNQADDVFLWSAVDDTVTRVSTGPNGEEANGDSRDPTISGDGSVVAFVTQATNVAPATNDSTIDSKVVRVDLASGEHTVVTRNKTTGDASEGAWPMLSEDGDRLVFWAYRDVTGDLNPNLWDVFVYEHSTKKQWPVSQAKTGENRDQGPDSASGVIRPAISGDGRWVTYGTSATNVVGTSDKLWHFYLVEADHCDASGCNVVLVDQAGGAIGDDDAASEYAPLSYDGSLVVFTSAASNLGVASSGYTNVFLYERATAALTPLTNMSSGYGGSYASATLSPDGAYAAFGAYTKLDSRFDTDGIFAAYTGRANAFSWKTQ